MRVLLVDDHREHRAMTRELLDLCGYQVLEAPGGPEALDLLEHLDFDVLLTDLVMPGMDGIELADRIAELRRERDLPAVAVLFMSVDNDFRNLRRRIVDGGTAFLRKPFSAAELAEALRAALARKPVPQSPSEARLTDAGEAGESATQATP